MIKIEHKYRMAIASKIMPARLIFDEKGPDQKLYTPVEGQEAVAPTPKKVADEKQKLDEKKIALQGRIDLYKKSSNDAIQKAAEQAQKDLDSVKDKPNLSVEQIQANLDKITKILEHADESRKLDERVKQMRENASSLAIPWLVGINTYNANLLKTHGKISEDAKKTLAMLLEGAHNDLDGNILLAIYTATQKPKVSLEDYSKDSQAFQKMNKILDGEESVLLGKSGDLLGKLAEIRDGYQAESHAVVILDYAKDQKTAVADAQHAAEYGEKQLDEWSKKNGNADVLYAKTKVGELGSNAVAMLKMLDKPGDVKKRALVLAQLKDDIISIVSDPAKAEISTDRNITAAVMKRGGMKHDVFSQDFAKFTESVPMTGVNLTDAQRNQSTFKITAHPNFRMEGSGLQMAVLTPGTEIRMMDSLAHHVETGTGKKVDYVRVQISPPNGPIGYVAQEFVDFKHPIIQLDEQNLGPDKPAPLPKPTPAAPPAAPGVIASIEPNASEELGPGAKYGHSGP